jgi:iron complex transport system ATP-binding protein
MNSEAIPPPRLELERLSVERAGRSVLCDVSLSFRPSELWAIVGPNGAGKSTLVEAIIGALPSPAGAIRLEGIRLGQRDARTRARTMALVGNESCRDLRLSVQNVVELGRLPYLGIWGGLTKEDLGAVDRALREAGCVALSARSVSSLSDGERQRVQFARALAQAPRVLLMDEATAHLDLGHRHAMLCRVRRFTALGGTALVVMHDLDLALCHATHAALIHHGRLHGAGPVDGVLTVDALRSVFGVEAEIVRHTRGSSVHVLGPCRIDGAPSGEGASWTPC